MADVTELPSQDLIARQVLAMLAGLTFGGQRDLYKTLGYDRNITTRMYRERFKRNGVARRVVSALPKATWRGGAELIEDENPDVITEFEQAWIDLDRRLNIWPMFYRLDRLARLGRYAVVLLGGLPGDLSQPVKSAPPDSLLYLQPYAQDAALISSIDADPGSIRYSQPVLYRLKTGATNKKPNADVHYTRIHHVADDVLEDNYLGTPALECIWNFLDDLEKVVGGGAEAFWIRANQGLHFNVDPDAELSPESEKKLDEEIKKYVHRQQRMLRTMGTEVKTLGSDVADFKAPLDAIFNLISASTGIPQRILMGSERGQLASSQDRTNWDESVTDRRLEYAGPSVVRPFVDHLIALGVLPTPVQYEPRWPQIQSLTIQERAQVANLLSGLSEEIILHEEIRDRILQLPKLTPEQLQEIADAKPKVDPNADPNDPNAQIPPVASAGAKREAKILRLNLMRKFQRKSSVTQPTSEGGHGVGVRR
jgi:hypothetical protein